MSSTRFSVAAHVLTQLARAEGQPVSSAQLVRPAAEIDLLEVWRATEAASVTATPRTPPSQECPVGCHILDVLGEVVGRAEAALFAELEGVTIASRVDRVAKCERGG